MNIIAPVKPATYGIKLRTAYTLSERSPAGSVISWPVVNINFAKVLEPLLKKLAHGPGVEAVSIYTYGIAFYPGRLLRGSAKTTSTHSYGLRETSGKKYSEYDHWRDGSQGSLGFDVTKIVIRHRNGLETSLTVTNPTERQTMIKFCKENGLRVWHEKPLKAADHIHLEPWDLKGIK
jgi:hypothetical protein